MPQNEFSIIRVGQRYEKEYQDLGVEYYDCPGGVAADLELRSRGCRSQSHPNLTQCVDFNPIQEESKRIRD